MQENINELTAAIRELNDQFRRTRLGGLVVVTGGLHAKGADFVEAALSAVAAFADFTEGNDPFGEHDFGRIELEGETILWKIDYYDARQPELSYGAPNPADPKETRRVLTVMLAAEY